MICVEFRSAADGVAREEALFAAGKPALLLWRSVEQSIVVPRNRARRAGYVGLSQGAARAGWPLILRSSGGGAVPQGPGTINLAIVAPMPKGAQIEDGYRLICGAISEALMRFEVASDTGAVDAAFCDGNWNVTAGGRKLAGTAQRWRPLGGGRSVALIHAAIVAAHPPDSVWPVLAQVEAQAGGILPPRHEVHIALSELLPEAMSPRALQGALVRAAEDRLKDLTAPRAQAA
ncbi:lipoate--protein ligase family protein [Mameliella sp.]|uniref:lipoate--protein ligase family protein n=1 Tax=Mameliella sp. TaxID=1924940 RepID=UPI003B50AF31